MMAEKYYKIMSLYTLTPLHVGSGKDVGVVDLPIQRERISNHPICYGSSFKGAMRQYYTGDCKTLIFGPDTGHAEDHGGCVSFTDARLLAFPIRSLKGAFVWITCPLVLERFERDLAFSGNSLKLSGDILNFSGKACVVKPEAGRNELLLSGQDKIVLEEYIIEASESENLRTLAETLSSYLPDKVGGHFREKFKKHLVLLSNELFSQFVTFCTEVVARVSLKEEKTVDQGPWYEENLPAESLLYSLLIIKDALKSRIEKNGEGKEKRTPLKRATEVADHFGDHNFPFLQMGGNETVGRGILALKFTPPASSPSTNETKEEE